MRKFVPTLISPILFALFCSGGLADDQQASARWQDTSIPYVKMETNGWESLMATLLSLRDVDDHQIQMKIVTLGDPLIKTEATNQGGTRHLKVVTRGGKPVNIEGKMLTLSEIMKEACAQLGISVGYVADLAVVGAAEDVTRFINAYKVDDYMAADLQTPVSPSSAALQGARAGGAAYFNLHDPKSMIPVLQQLLKIKNPSWDKVIDYSGPDKGNASINGYGISATTILSVIAADAGKQERDVWNVSTPLKNERLLKPVVPFWK